MKELVLAAVVALGLLLLFGGVPGEGPAPATETGTAPEVASAPAVGGGKTAGEGLYYDRALDRMMRPSDLPFFVRPYRQFGPDDDPMARAQEVWRAIYETSILFSTPAINFGSVVEREWEFFGGRKVRVVYTSIYSVDGEYVYSTMGGPVSLATVHPKYERIHAQYLRGELSEETYRKVCRILSAEELKKIDRFLYYMFSASLKDLDKTYLEYIRAARRYQEERFGVSLDTPVPWDVDPPITLGEVLGLYLYRVEDYLPDVLYFGRIAAWGYFIAGPNIPVGGRKPERRMGLHPEAVVFDWILGKHSVVFHELVHSVQAFPLFWYVDAELLNEILSNAVDMYELDFLYHSYLARMRAIAYRHFNFDADYARDYVTAYKVGGVVEFHRDRFLEMARKVDQIAKEMRYLAERTYELFYRDPLFWIALCDQMKDDAMILDVVAALTYELTCIGGSAEETNKWLRAHHNQIMQIGERTLQELKDEERKREENLDLPRSILAVSWWRRIPPEIQERIVSAYLAGGLDAVVELFREGRWSE